LLAYDDVKSGCVRRTLPKFDLAPKRNSDLATAHTQHRYTLLRTKHRSRLTLESGYVTSRKTCLAVDLEPRCVNLIGLVVEARAALGPLAVPTHLLVEEVPARFTSFRACIERIGHIIGCISVLNELATSSGASVYWTNWPHH
jgi:hypothetical protein